MQDPIVAFYSGGTDDRGRTLEEIWSWSDEELEAVHDYIQWVFPTERRSPVNPGAPLVTRDTIQAFKSQPELRDRLRQSLDRMLAFYGLRRVLGGAPAVEIDDAQFAERAPDWLRPRDHNHLRLTRIMECLATLGLRAEAKALQRCLTKDIYEGPGRSRISFETYDFWLDALKD